jgi:hypothetical protein
MMRGSYPPPQHRSSTSMIASVKPCRPVRLSTEVAQPSPAGGGTPADLTRLRKVVVVVVVGLCSGLAYSQGLRAGSARAEPPTATPSEATVTGQP